MKVLTGILVFGIDEKESKLITDNNLQLPVWELKDENRQSLDIVTEGLYNISGVDKTWYPNAHQALTVEMFEKYKEIYILYTMYFPGIFTLNNLGYRWTSLKELPENDKLYNIIRYLYGMRK